MDKNLKQKNRVVALALLAFIALIFCITLAKMHYNSLQ